MYRGLLSRNMRLSDLKGRIVDIETQRIVNMSNPHIGAIRYFITPENYSGPITIRSGIDGNVRNVGVARYRKLNSLHLKARSLGKIAKNVAALSVKTNQSGIVIASACKTRIFSRDKEITPSGKVITENKKAIYQDYKICVHRNNEYVIEKICAIYTSRDSERGSISQKAIKTVRASPRFGILFEPHKKVWSRLWKKFDINIKGDIHFRKVLRLHAFHLLQSASYHNLNIDAGVPARGLHGEAYRGHIFWDQLFAMPFYNMRAPEIAKTILLYRYRRLICARKNARGAGYKGAMFPWQSSMRGDEQTQSVHLNPMSGKWGPDYSHHQRHVSFAVAYNVWQYWVDTHDVDFMLRYGLEIMLSVCLFGSSLARFAKKDGRFHVEGVMGPDEFHEHLPGAPNPGFCDNAYTNFLIVAIMDKTLQLLDTLPQEQCCNLLKKLKVSQQELDRWDSIIRKMNLIINKKGIISQFKGYFKLRELNWRAYKKKYGNIHRMDRILKAEGRSPNEYKVAKQADVLMIFYLFPLSEIKFILKRLGYKFDREIFRKNYEYHIRRTSHGSTLSKVVHSYLASLLNRGEEVWDWYLDVLKSDIYDTQGGTTPEGIHTGVMGGSINIAVKSFAGVSIEEGRIRINPNLPKDWYSMKFRLVYHGYPIFISVTHRQITIFIQGRKAQIFHTPIFIYDQRYELECRKIHKISLERKAMITIEGGVQKMVQERILIVDGDISQAVMLKTRLEAMGYLVDCAYAGNNALNILKTHWVDLIILSVVLQAEMSGFQLFKEVKSNKQFCDIPIIMQTKKKGMKETFQHLGADAFFVKPYTVDKLLKEVKNIIANKVY